PVITKLNPESGKAGSAVKIEGFNFSTVDSENKVLFGSLDAGLPIVNTAATELEVTVPPGLSAGEHTVRLSVTGFTTISAPKKYRVLSATSGIFESSADNGLKVYTNNEGLNLSIKTKKPMLNSKVVIYDIRGLIVFEQGFDAEGQTEFVHTMNPELHSGIYILSLEDENNGIKTQKFVVAQ
ncbi:T9SS type A sorting domain-containing protein, partial [Salibacteraceae bacterium]|nr:T9SS type A sorting domain-containing protein [Salibacteraceae bacterium]